MARFRSYGTRTRRRVYRRRFAAVRRRRRTFRSRRGKSSYSRGSRRYGRFSHRPFVKRSRYSGLRTRQSYARSRATGVTRGPLHTLTRTMQDEDGAQFKNELITTEGYDVGIDGLNMTFGIGYLLNGIDYVDDQPREWQLPHSHTTDWIRARSVRISMKMVMSPLSAWRIRLMVFHTVDDLCRHKITSDFVPSSVVAPGVMTGSVHPAMVASFGTDVPAQSNIFLFR